jgi:beta-lactamase class D
VFAQSATFRVDIRAELARRFGDDGTVGVFAAYNARGISVVASDARRRIEAILPASTFKILNSIIALEIGVVADPDKDVFKWDGLVCNFPNWNRDHTSARRSPHPPCRCIRTSRAGCGSKAAAPILRPPRRI